jgi:hypothetical protein
MKEYGDIRKSTCTAAIKPRNFPPGNNNNSNNIDNNDDDETFKNSTTDSSSPMDFIHFRTNPFPFQSSGDVSFESIPWLGGR